MKTEINRNKSRLIILLGLLCCIFLIQFLIYVENQDQKQNKKEYKVIAYVAGWKNYDLSKIEAEKLTHINYAFANIINGEVKFGNPEDTIDNATLNIDDLKTIQKLKIINPDLKLLISVGGWTWSTHFSDVALTDSSRKRFAGSAVSFLKRYQLDGIDLDWEYPNQKGAGNTYRPEDVENFTLLLKEVRQQLNEQSKIDGLSGNNKYLLTIATGGDKAYIENTNLGEAHKYLDFINIMTYDYYHGNHYYTGHHANLKPAENDPAPQTTGDEIKSIVSSVQGHILAGVPKEKICLGVPFYGRMWNEVEPENNGLFQKANTTGSIVNYRSIVNNYLANKDFKQLYDSSACVPYLWNAANRVFISYENPHSLKQKIAYIKKMDLGGVMFWEYANDNNSDLLHTIYWEFMK